VLDTLFTHVNVDVPVPTFCALDNPANTAKTADAVIHLRKSTISSFSLWISNWIGRSSLSTWASKTV